MRSTIVLVDDAQARLDRLERALVSRGVAVHRTLTSAAARTAAREPGVTAIVTPCRVTDGDGVTLLAKVRDATPGVVRVFVPEGGAPEHVLRAVGVASHVLARPDDADELLGAVERAEILERALDNTRLRRLAGLPGGLPALPPLYLDLVEALQGPDATLDRVADVLAHDEEASAKLLELVNSAWFGLMERVTSVAMAINYLGVMSVSSLVLSRHLFRDLGKSTLTRLGLASLWDRSLLAGTYARALSIHEGLSSRETDDAFSASLLHGAGRALLASRAEEDYAEVLRRGRDQGLAVADAEKKLLGFTGELAGAFLLRSWGLPVSITEAVCFRTNPADLPHRAILPLTITHVAVALASAGAPHRWSPRSIVVDEPYLEALTDAQRLETWKTVCAEAVSIEEAPA